jgi:lipopolysaccharide/colanic/teichoic acid biosynthesis glycosyltransferase
MKLWPVILDSQPGYLQGRGRSGSLLFAPLGTGVLIEHLTAALSELTDNPPLIVAREDAERQYTEWIHAICPRAKVVATPEALAESLAGHELSDALLFVDPRCMPSQGFLFGPLLRQHQLEPRIAHHLVAFEKAHDGTKERVCFDAAGQVRAIQRRYEQATWSFVAGIAASVVPSAVSDATEGVVPRSLVELRELLNKRGALSRDIPLGSDAVDLTEERGLLAANERLILEANLLREGGDGPSAPVFVGGGHAIHASARMLGPVIVHANVWVEANATVLGPAVIGEGARVGSGAVVAHATIGSNCDVPPNTVVRDRAWFRSCGDAPFGGVEKAPMSYTERLARVSFDTPAAVLATPQAPPVSTTTNLALKRAMDITLAACGLLLALPLLVVTAIAVWLESRGPIFYGDEREGVQGRVFKCWKFRTMYTGAHAAQRELKALNHADGPHFKVDRDPRVTKVGRILRSLNLDELPQLFNVLTGEMSLVGPRPSPFRENQVCVPWRAARLAVQPGITGFWQVCRHNRSEGDFHQWIEYDLLYVQHMSFWLDVKILTATLLTLGGKLSAVSPSSLVNGPPAVLDMIPVEPVQPKHEAERVA